MALQELLAALDAESSAELDRDRQEREQEAERILTQAREDADRVREQTIDAARTAAEGEALRLLAAAREDARNLLRRARTTALDAVHDAVHRELADLPGTEDGATATAESFREAVAALPSTTRAHVHAADAGAVNEAANDRLEVLTDLEDGGVLLEDDAGRSVDNTWPTRLANAWPGLQVELSSRWGAQ